MSQERRVSISNPADVAPPAPSYSHVATVPMVPNSTLVMLAGQIGTDPISGKVPSDFSQQIDYAYQNVANCLRAVGASPQDIVHVRHYVVKETGTDLDKLDIADRGSGRKWIKFMDEAAGGHRPPSTLIGVASLAKPEMLYEVEVWAIVYK